MRWHGLKTWEIKLQRDYANFGARFGLSFWLFPLSGAEEARAREESCGVCRSECSSCGAASTYSDDVMAAKHLNSSMQKRHYISDTQFIHSLSF